jgi:RimJ/RimL family protein N-acetyltransferase
MHFIKFQFFKNKPVGFVSLSDIDYENKTTDWGLYIADKSLREKRIGRQTLNKLIVYI